MTSSRLSMLVVIFGSVLAVLATLSSALVVQAAPQGYVYYVNGTSDPIPSACTLSLGGYACPSLRSAVIAANVNPGWDTIVLKHGKTYSLTIPFETLADNDAASGDLDIAGHIDFGFGNVICFSNCGATIQGEHGRLFDIPANIRVSMTSLTLRDGLESIGEAGGAIRNAGILTLTNSLVAYNVSAMGGGIYNAISGTLYLFDTRVYTNHTLGINGQRDGGGLHNAGVAYLTNVTIEQNFAALQGGGVGNTGQMIVNGGVISGNWAYNLFQALGGGGGLWSGADGRLTMTATQILDNWTEFGGGGGLAVSTGSAVTLTQVTVSGNTAQENGGGVSNDGTLRLINSTLSGNFAYNGGGGLVNQSADAHAYLNNVTVVNNWADADANGSGQGGGLWASLGTLSIVNTLVAQNTSLGVNSPDCSGPLSSGGYNLIESITGCTLSGTLTGNLLGKSPKIGPLQDNGGSTWTHALLIGSPAINAGNTSMPGTSPTACQSDDQRGVIRPAGERCDIGAYEYATVQKVYLPVIQR